MKKVMFTIKTHADRMKLFETLQNNGYDVDIKCLTNYVPTRYVVVVSINDNEVTE